MKFATLQFFLIMVVIVLLPIMVGCAPEISSHTDKTSVEVTEESTDKLVRLVLADYVRDEQGYLNLFAPRTAHPDAEATGCLQRLRFISKVDEDEELEFLEATEIEIEPMEANLFDTFRVFSEAQIPLGHYTHIELDFEDACPLSRSLLLSNASGIFSTNESFTVQFSGSFSTDDNDLIVLNINAMLDELSFHDGSQRLVDTASAEGAYFE